MNELILRTLCALCFCCCSAVLTAQYSAGGLPPSFQNEFKAVFLQQRLRTTTLPALDMAKIKQEDAQLEGTVRFAAPMAVNLQPQKDGQWMVLPNGDQVWRLRIKVPQALGLFVVYRGFQLPQGARLFVYSANQRQLKGAYTQQNNKAHQKMMTGMITGEETILEYWLPKGVDSPNPFVIERLYVAYNTDHIQPPDSEFKTYDGFGDAMDCNVNINCPSGSTWQNHKRGIVRILRIFDEGVGWCTGSLINNTNEDGTPYILSAFHCIAGFTPNLPLWRFDFNYESPDCNNPLEEPAFQSLLGCQYRSGREQTDFLLLELEDEIPHHFNVFYNGWNRTPDFVPSQGTGIHHARGDIKKISKDNDPAFIFSNSINWSNGVTTPPNHHFRFVLDEGTIEDGSSGSPIFDQNGWITGQLHGGNADCNTNTFITYYGRFSLSWADGGTIDTRLQEWLDPANTGQLILGTYELPRATISGRIQTSVNQNLAGVKVNLSGAVSDSVVTDTSGVFSFVGLPAGADYVLSFDKNDDAGNGINVLDVILTANHILGTTPFVDPNQLTAANVIPNSAITAFDLVEMRKIILNILDDFSEVPSWVFDQNDIAIDNLSEDTSFDIIGIKMGDVNFNASPD
ncbi:MAG: hypothetical protein AAGD05_00795 [Bacteroidota bacterium]